MSEMLGRNGPKSKLKAIIRIVGTYFFIVFLMLGIFLLIIGISMYKNVTFESTTKPSGIIILGDEDTVIDDLKIQISKESAVQVWATGWMGTLIEFSSSRNAMNLLISLPHEVAYVHFINYTQLNYFYTKYSYNKSDDMSTLFLSYSSSSDKNRIRILFDWNICERLSYDQERVALAFSTPYFGRPLFREILPLWGEAIPKIERLTIQIDSYHVMDPALTMPQPSYFYYSEGITSVYWVFDSRREVSPVQAVFKNLSLSEEKSRVIFESGILIAFGISGIMEGLRGFVDLTKQQSEAQDRTKVQEFPEFQNGDV